MVDTSSDMMWLFEKASPMLVVLHSNLSRNLEYTKCSLIIWYFKVIFEGRKNNTELLYGLAPLNQAVGFNWNRCCEIWKSGNFLNTLVFFKVLHIFQLNFFSLLLQSKP